MGKDRLNRLSAMRLCLAKKIGKLYTSWWFESPDTDLHIAENTCCMDYADTWSSTPDHQLSTSQSPYCCTSDYGYDVTLELFTMVDPVCLPRLGICTRDSSKSTIQWLPATLHNPRWIDHCEVCHRSIKVIPISHPVHVEEAYSLIESCYHGVQ